MKPTIRRIAWVPAAVLALVPFAPTQPALAQPPSQPAPPPPSPSPSPAVSPATDAVASDLAARAIARISLLDLKMLPSPAPRDYRIAAAVLGIASDLAPNDTDILNLLVDAASAAGDRARVMALTHRLVRLDPSNTVAQLRLISARVSDLQDADARLASYARFLGPEGESIDAAIRSRLALDSALLLRERGDMEGFASRLTQAIALDSTNKDAASLAVTYFTEQVDDAPGRLDLLLTLLRADPLDPDTHMAIARELAAGGAYAASRRFFSTLLALLGAQGVDAPANLLAEVQTVQWNANGAAAVVTGLRDLVDTQRNDLKDRRAAMEKAGQPLTEVPKPQQLHLPIEIERVRLAAASAMGDEAQTDFAYQELLGAFQETARELGEPGKRPKGVSEAAAADRQRWLFAELQWMRLWSGRDLDGAAEAIEQLKKDPSVKPEGLARFQGWLRLRRDDLAGAEALLAPLAPTDPLAELGLAVLAEKRNPSEAAPMYADLSRRFAGSITGAWARTRATVLTGAAPEQPPQAGRLEALAKGVPAWLEEMVVSPRRYISMQASLQQRQVGVLDKPVMHLVVRNVGPIPLAMGPEKTINTRLLLVPHVEIGLQMVGGISGPEVVRLDRRLRLMPQESFETTVCPTLGALGWFLEQTSGASARLRWRVLQGFRVTKEGLYETGPNCLATETDAVIRSPSPKARADAPALSAWIATGSIQDLAEAILTIRWQSQLAADAPGAFKTEDRAAIAKALGARCGTLDRLGRLVVLSMTPSANLIPEMAPLDAMARQETDPALVAVTLITRVTKPDDEWLVRQAGSSDATVAELAALLQDKLSEDVSTYSRRKTAPVEGPAPVPAPGGAGTTLPATAPPAGTGK